MKKVHIVFLWIVVCLVLVLVNNHNPEYQRYILSFLCLTIALLVYTLIARLDAFDNFIEQFLREIDTPRTRKFITQSSAYLTKINFLTKKATQRKETKQTHSLDKEFLLLLQHSGASTKPEVENCIRTLEQNHHKKVFESYQVISNPGNDQTLEYLTMSVNTRINGKPFGFILSNGKQNKPVGWFNKNDVL